MLKLLTLAALTTLLFAGCTFTTTIIKNPIFSASNDSIKAALNKLVTFEHVTLNGQEITTNGKANAEMEIDVINGQNIPEDDKEMANLAAQIAASIKSALQNKNEYNTYKVLFIKRNQKGGVTESNWTGRVFESKDL